ncbi:MAG: TetR family transcriptional regulator [Hyphomicrobiales bacterium]|nr:MAG: TetR family transcriptional regulator [Hyphomicrobiales bacterium]
MARKAAKPEPAEEQGRSSLKRQAILAAATKVFLKEGYLGTNMDEIAALSEVSKQTVYKHFASKEALFVEIVSSMTNDTGDKVHHDAPVLAADGDIEAYLADYAYTQLAIVVTPQVMQLRRLVIGEVGRFPALARTLYERGPLRAIGMLTRMIEDLAARGLLRVDDAKLAAAHLNWLVMSQALNEAMLLGDAAIPRPAELRRQAAAGVKVFLAAYGTR